MGGRTFQKLSDLGGVQSFLLERGDKPVKGGGVDVKMGGAVVTFLLLYSSVIFTVCEGK